MAMTSSRSRLRFSSVVALAVAAAAMMGAPATSAVATPATDGFWYFDAFHIQDAHDAGLTGEGVTIAVLDTQINLDVPTLQDADIEVQESNCYDNSGDLISPTSTDMAAEHGTNVVSYLVGSGKGYPGQTGVKGIVPDAKIIYTLIGLDTDPGLECKAEDSGDIPVAAANGVYAAIDAGADIISVSMGGSAEAGFVLALAHAVHEGIVVVASVANEQVVMSGQGHFPGNGNGVVGVQSIDAKAEIQGTSTTNPLLGVENANTDVAGPGVNVVWQGDSTWDEQRYATGTSIATPIVAGFIALVAQRYPDATGNQLIQTLFTNTNGDDHPLSYDTTYGYGVASATHMLEKDPTDYPDVNLAVKDDPREIPSAEMIGDPPTLEQFLSGYETASAAEADGFVSEEEYAAPPDPSSFDWSIVYIALGGLLLPVIAGGVILTIVLVNKRSKKSAPGAQP